MKAYDAFGLVFCLPSDLDPVDEITYRYASRTQTLRYDVNPGDIVVEVGAFCGLHAMRLAQRVGPTGFVVAVEMIPEYANLCLANANLNDFHNISVGWHAVGDSGTRLAHLDHHQRNSLEGGIVAQDGSAENLMWVRSQTLDETLAPYAVVDLLIIQINGTELDALQAVTCWDKIKNLAIATQYWQGGHDHEWYKPFTCPPIVELLRSKGFEVEEIDSWVYAR